MGNSTLFWCDYQLCVSEVSFVYVVVHILSFLNSALFFHSLPMGSGWTACCLSVLNFTLCTPHHSVKTWKKWATQFTGNLINRSVAQCGWGLHLTAGTTVRCSLSQTVVSVLQERQSRTAAITFFFSHALPLYIIQKIEISETVIVSLPLIDNRLRG